MEPISLPAAYEEVREKAHELLVQISRYFYESQQPISEIIIVPSVIFSRIIGTHDSIRTLLLENYVPDAAIIALAQFELRLQLAWTAHDVKNASAWIAHPDLFSSPIRIKQKLKEYFKYPTVESTRLLSIFSHLSGVKHGNPFMSELVFGARTTADGISFSTGIIEDAFLERFAVLLARYSVYQVAWCSQLVNLYVAKYADVEHQLKERLRRIGQENLDSEVEICSFMEEVTIRQRGFFGLKARREGK
jgi:hypothetical protein